MHKNISSSAQLPAYLWDGFQFPGGEINVSITLILVNVKIKLLLTAQESSDIRTQLRVNRAVQSLFLVTCICFCSPENKIFFCLQMSFVALSFFLDVIFNELKTILTQHLLWNDAVTRNTVQQHGRGLTWCICYLWTIIICSVHFACQRDWAPGKASLPEWHSVDCFLCLFFFLPGCGLQERYKSQMHGHIVWGGWQKKESKKVH